MFFEGSLQEGIATALQQSKLVVCFVTDGESESQKWETEFLTDDALREPLSTQAVMLKLQAGSTEAGYLAAIFPLPKTPTLVIMNKGQLKEYIAAGTSKQDFISRAAKALATASQQQQQQQPSASASTPNQPTAAATPSPAPAPAPAPPTASAPSTTPQPQPSPQVQSLLTERAARLEAQRKREAEQRRLDKGKAKADATPSKPKDPAQEKYSEDLKRRQKQAREDRARILQAIEDDKAARRAKVAERAAERAGEAGVPVSVLSERERESGGKEGDGEAGWCKLQIRLFDGSTVRGRWAATESLGREVRGWLDGQEGMKGVAPAGYGFKVVLTPKPSRGIDVADEGKSLRELGLSPSATLVLVPTARGKGVGAYPGAAGGGNVVVRVVMAVLGVFAGLWALVVGFFGSLFGAGPASPAPAVRGGDGGGAAAASGRDQGRKGGLRRLRPEGEEKDGQQFYNGNSTNFEPRKDDDDEQ